MTHFTRPSALASFGCALLIGALSLSAPAQAQTKKELAAKVIQLQPLLLENIGNGLADQVAQQELQRAGRAMASVPVDKREALGKDVQAEITRFRDELSSYLRDRANKLAPEAVGPVLEEKFTEDELKQLAAWLDSPLSKKYQQSESQIQGLLVQKLIEDTRPSVEPKLRALEQSLQKKFAGVAATPAAPASGAGKPAAVKKK